MANPAPTLARRLGTTEHRSVLLHRAAALGLRDEASLAALAARRGLRYYPVQEPERWSEPPLAAFDNAELAVALLHPAWTWEPQRIRLGAAMLAAEDVQPRLLALLATQERCEAVVRHVAEAGAKCEPQNAFWPKLWKEDEIAAAIAQARVPDVPEIQALFLGAQAALFARH